MVEETVEDIEESLDWFLWIWGDLSLTLLLITGLVPVDWSISMLLKIFTEGKKVRWLLDWIVELKGVGKLNLFAVSSIGATIQDGGKRKRSVWNTGVLGQLTDNLNNQTPAPSIIHSSPGWFEHYLELLLGCFSDAILDEILAGESMTFLWMFCVDAAFP